MLHEKTGKLQISPPAQNKGLKSYGECSIIGAIRVDIIFVIFCLKMKGAITMTEKFGNLPTGEEATLYTISCGKLTAAITDCGAALVKLLVPDANGNIADVVLGCAQASGYFPGGAFLGAPPGK